MSFVVMKGRSATQIEASRRDGSLSRGSKTHAGRALPRLSAIKRGLLAKRLVACGGIIDGSPAEYLFLRRDLYDSLQPAGPTECLLVDHIAAIFWRDLAGSGDGDATEEGASRADARKGKFQEIGV